MTLKEQITALLAGNSMKGYLEGIELLRKYVGTENLPDEDIDQEIFERACAVMIYEKWAEHNDYYAALEKFMDTIPQYENLLTDDEIGHYLRGMAIFIDSINQGAHDLSGFVYASHSGWLMSSTAAEQIAEKLEERKDLETAAFFREVQEFFENINSAQYSLIRLLMDIEKWNSEMATGFYNIMTASDLGTQYWMLGGLYKAVNDPVVKNEIFGKYLKVLYKVRDNYISEGNNLHADEVNEIISNVESKSRGE